MRSTALNLAVLLSTSGMLVGCGASLTYRSPDACAECLMNSRGEHTAIPVEEDFGGDGESADRVQAIEASPTTPWRSLGDVKTQATNPADMLSDLKVQAAARGADAILRLAEGSAGTRTTSEHSGGSFSVPIGKTQVSGDAESSSSETVMSYAGIATAVRRATPGSEARVGISCLVLPNGIQQPDQPPTGILVIGDVDGPAARAGLHRGQVIWTVLSKKAGVDVSSSQSCRAFARYVQRVGPGGELQLSIREPTDGEELLGPFDASKYRDVTIKLEAIPDSAYRVGDAPFTRAPTPPKPPVADAAPTTPPAASGGCTKDTDCKGDRICVKGACTDPADKPKP